MSTLSRKGSTQLQKQLFSPLSLWLLLWYTFQSLAFLFNSFTRFGIRFPSLSRSHCVSLFAFIFPHFHSVVNPSSALWLIPVLSISTSVIRGGGGEVGTKQEKAKQSSLRFIRADISVSCPPSSLLDMFLFNSQHIFALLINCISNIWKYSRNKVKTRYFSLRPCELHWKNTILHDECVNIFTFAIHSEIVA